MPDAIRYLVPYTLMAAAVIGLQIGGFGTFLAAGLTFLLLPLLDRIFGIDEDGPSGEDERDRAQALGYRLVTWAWVPAQAAFLLWALWIVSSHSLTWVEWIGFTIAVGLNTGGIGIVYAHELVHRPGRFERGLAEVLMAMVGYTHFCIEHVRGHHVKVGTAADPASARPGESFYRYYPRAIWGGLRSAWSIETARLGRDGRRWWSPRNRMLRYLGTQVTLYGLIVAVFGWAAALFFAAQAVYAFSLLETINYVEHYGLTRREVAPGRFEPVRPGHSWNASHRLSNWYLINLMRHSDHHCHAGRRYQVLRHCGEAEAPQLPFSYAVMSLIALVPPLWFRMMDPKVADWYGRRDRRAAAGTAAT